MGPALAAGICLALGLAILTSTLLSIFESRILGPTHDLWRFMPAIEALKRDESLLPFLLEPHGVVHRLVVPKLFYFAEYAFFAGENIFMRCSSTLTQLAFVLILLSTLERANHLRPSERVFTVGFALALGFSSSQYGTFLRP